MRSVMIAALSAWAALAMVSVASAQNGRGVSDPSAVSASHAPTVRDENGSGVNGLSVEQEDAIPYRPCTEPLGWENGRLRCRND